MDLYAANGAVPAEQIRGLLDHLRHNPRHPGPIIRRQCLGDWMTVGEAARQLCIAPAELQAVLDGEAAVSHDLAASMERIGWSTADVWIGVQADYDRARDRQAA